MNEALIKFIEYLSKSSPILWQQMVAYHRAQAQMQLTVDVLVLILAVIGLLGAWKTFKTALGQEGEFLYLLGVILLVGSTISSSLTLYQLPVDFSDAMVPERAAALDMIEQMKKVK